MTKFLINRFVKDSENSSLPHVRSAYGKLAGFVGIFCNVLLFFAKGFIGFVSGSVSITADAINNLSDASASVVTLVGFKLAEKPADQDHPYGHARMEYLAGLVVAAIIMYIGVELLKSSWVKILNPQPIEFSWIIALIMVLSIALKYWPMIFNRTLGKNINSQPLLATAADCRNDVLTTTAVLLSCIISHFTHWMLDGYVGALVAIFILYSGASIVKDTIDPLLGIAPTEDLTKMVSTIISAYPKVLGLHDLIVHDYGPCRRFATVHIEMDCREDPLLCHDIIDNIERDFDTNHNIHLVIHYDPIITNSEELNHMREVITSFFYNLDNRLNLHDFRMVQGPTHTNLVFDLVIPFNITHRRKELLQSINDHLRSFEKKYYAVITFDDSTFHH